MLFLIQGIKCKISSGSLERCFLGKVYSAVMSLCCLEIWPRTERKEFLFRMLMSLSCITLTKAALTTAPWMHLLFPGYSLCILSHECFILLRKKKKAQWGKYPRCIWDLCHDTKYTACIHNSWWKVTHQPPLHDRQFPYAMRNQTHWIFVGPVLPLCVIAHWDYPLKRGIFKPTLLLFQLILSSFNSYFSSFGVYCWKFTRN